MNMMKKMIPAMVCLMWAGTAVNAAETVLFSEDFEAPDVTGYAEGTKPAGWASISGGFGSNRHGLVDKDSGAFIGSASNDQAYAFRYTSGPRIVTDIGEIGAIEADVMYTITFEVQQDLGDTNTTGGAGDWYKAQLLAYTNGSTRADNTTATVLIDDEGTVPTNGQFHTITMTYTADPIADADLVGQDLAVLFFDVWASENARTTGVIDNLLVTRPTPPPTGTAITIK